MTAAKIFMSLIIGPLRCRYHSQISHSAMHAKLSVGHAIPTTNERQLDLLRHSAGAWAIALIQNEKILARLSLQCAAARRGRCSRCQSRLANQKATFGQSFCVTQCCWPHNFDIE